MMKKLIVISLLGIAFVLAGQPAAADHRGYGYGYKKHHHYKHHHKRKHHYKRKHRHRHKHYHRHYHRNDNGDEILAAAGIIGGAVLLGSILSQPRYAAPPPARTYYAPPPRQPHCVVDDVYRYLPDGRVQWGERRRCY